MPQLTKGGKFTYGWSMVGDTGRIVVPQPALEEYQLHESQRLILLPGSRTSGGFALGSYDLVSGSPFGGRERMESICGVLELSEGEVTTIDGRPHCWVRLRGGTIELMPQTLSCYGVRVGDRLLVIRGSRLAVAFAARGPIVDGAKKHVGLDLYAP